MIRQHSAPLSPEWVYRFESIDPLGGLWYNSSSEWVFENGIKTIDNPAVHELPMDYDARYRKDGRNWHSAVRYPSIMTYWFKKENIAELLEQGFVLYKYLATEYVHYEHETCFIKETSLTRELLNPYTFWTDNVAQTHTTPMS